MNNNINDIKRMPGKKKNKWLTIVGGVALLTVGFVLYKKRQTKLGSSLMASSVNMIAGAVAV